MTHRFGLTDSGPTTKWFHLGADLPSVHANTAATVWCPTSTSPVKTRRRVLMVGTLEPRKGHAQALDAFDMLWRSGYDASLIVAGRQGWHVDSLSERLRSHPEVGKRLFWLQDINDEQLSQLYTNLDGLLMASEAEGFGLPLVEAAQYDMPLFVRDLPVFREVAGEHATYFTARTGRELAPQLAEWLGELDRGTVAPSHGMKSLTWSASAEQLKALIAELD